jgi:hypothetical protein
MEDSSGLKHQHQEEIIKMTLGSIYVGEALYYASVTWLSQHLFQPVQTPLVLSDYHARFLLTSIIDN